MTTVNISGTWSEKQRPNNGLERVADLIHGNRIIRVPVVGYVEYHQWTEKLTGDVLTVAIPVIEACLADDGGDPHGRGQQTMDLIDQLRKERGVGSVDDVPLHSGEIAGQEALDFDPVPDDEREVPEASGEELTAELDERRAAKAAKTPAAEFSGGAQ